MPKPWERKKSYPARKSGSKGKPKDSLLILCEGERTEPYYFKSFRVTSADVKIQGLGYNTLSLVQEAVRLKHEAQIKNEPYDEVWCVFDRDSFPAQSVNNAHALARSNNIKTAFSNEAFEIWYLLHFNHITSGLSRTQYSVLLTRCLKIPYKKNMENIYDLLVAKQKDAIRNATALQRSCTTINYASANPITQVHLLVQKLNSLA